MLEVSGIGYWKGAHLFLLSCAIFICSENLVYMISRLLHPLSEDGASLTFMSISQLSTKKRWPSSANVEQEGPAILGFFTKQIELTIV